MGASISRVFSPHLPIYFRPVIGVTIHPICNWFLGPPCSGHPQILGKPENTTTFAIFFGVCVCVCAFLFSRQGRYGVKSNLSVFSASLPGGGFRVFF